MEYRRKDREKDRGIESPAPWSITFFAVLFFASALTLFILAGYKNVFDIALYPDPPQEYANGAFGRKTELKNFDVLRKQENELDRLYLQRITKLVSEHLIHYWPEDRRYTAVHVLDNYIFWGLSHLQNHQHFSTYEFMTPESALRRGYGYCSQAARIIYSVLMREKIQSDIFDHRHHVVVQVELYDTSLHVIDADYGVYIPHSLSDLKKDHSLVKEYYSNFPGMIPALVDIYREGFVESAASEIFRSNYKFEGYVAILCWAIPFCLLILSILLFTIARYYSAWSRDHGDAHKYINKYKKTIERNLHDIL